MVERHDGEPVSSPPLVGGHPAIDLLNTWCRPSGETLELLPDGRALVAWLVVAGLLDDASAARLCRRTNAAELDACADEVRRLREWARGWIVRWREAPGADYAREVSALNRLLARAPSHRELVQDGGRFVLEDRQRVASPHDVVALLAERIALLFAEEDPTLVKDCAGPACTLSFVDRTKSHRRVFCSPTACGNRAKVAAFRARQREDS